MPTKRARRLRSHVCVVLHYPMQKTRRPETKEVRERRLEMREERRWPMQSHC